MPNLCARIWMLSSCLMLACGANKTANEVLEASDAAIHGADAGRAESMPMPPLADRAIDTTEIMIGADPTTVCFPSQGQDLPLALMLQGANVERKHYSAFCRRVAAYGFVVVLPDHQNPLFNGLFPEASQLMIARNALRQQAGEAGSPLRGIVDADRFAVLGHSFGATTGLSLAEGLRDVPVIGTPEPIQGLAAVVLFAAGGQTMAIQNGKVPVAMVNGSLDTKSTPNEALSTYRALAGERKVLVMIDGLQHYGICDVDNPEGAAAETVTPEVAQEDGAREVADVMGTLLRAFVLEDDTAWQEVTVDLPRRESRVHVTLKR